jgi:eukaryotic-like serine/threonine-protein kinase
MFGRSVGMTSHDFSLSGDQERGRQLLLDRFKHAVRTGHEPRIEDFLPADVRLRHDLIVELIRIELEHRIQAGGEVRIDQYGTQFAELSRNELLDLARAEFQIRKGSDPELSLDDFASRYPDWAAALSGKGVKPGAPPQVVIEVVEGPHRDQRFEFDQHATLLVGRSSSAQLCLHDDAYFSRFHFRLEINPPDVYFIDLGSRNGTAVNGRRVKERRLHDGDIISGGMTKLRLRVLRDNPSSQSLKATVYQHATAAASKTIFGTQTDGDTAGDTRIPMIPGYDIVAELGTGGMGIVYHAIQKSSSKDVALKVILPQHATSEHAMQLFAREVNNLCQLNHRRIVGFKEFGMHAGQMYLAMEYVKTVDLNSIIGAISKRAALRIPCAIACQVLEALEYAHAKSLVHRDIKPTNILLSKPNKKLHVKLADFGVSKNYFSAGFSEMTSEHESRGTLAYMPPEQIIDCRYAKPPADIYAVGATLYYFLSGTPLFDFTTASCAFAMVLEAEPIPLEERLPDCPPELSAIIHRALAKDPEKRFGTAKEMRQSLEPFSRKRRS